jgi:hypothetical protein
MAVGMKYDQRNGLLFAAGGARGFVPIGPNAVLGPARTLALSGPAANTSTAMNLNGIVATPDCPTLIVARTAGGRGITWRGR